MKEEDKHIIQNSDQKTTETKNIRVLFVEDDIVDQMAFKRMVKDKGLNYSITQAGSVSEAHSRLETESFDIVLTDYSLGDGTAFDVIPKIENTPVIFITGMGNEELAINAMKAGAHDYIIKDPEHNHLQVLPITVENAIHHHNSAERLKESEERYRLLVESANDIIYKTDFSGNFTFVNDVAPKLTGYTIKEILSMHFLDLIRNDYRDKAAKFYSYHFKNHTESTYFEFPVIKKSGEEFWVGQNVSLIYGEKNKIDGFQAVARDITEKKQAEEKIKNQNIQLEQQNKEIKDTLEQLVKAKVSRKAGTVVLIIAVLLFIISEVILEPIIESSTDSPAFGYFFKFLIAVILKPIDVLVERYLMNQEVKKHK